MSDRRCSGTNQQGEACGAPPAIVDPETGFCPAHGPGGSAEMSRRGTLGGWASTAKNRSPGLDPDDLPPLDSHEAAKIWCERVGRAVATGRLGPSEGNTIIKAVKAWIDSEEHRAAAEALEQLERVARSAEEGSRFRPPDGPDGPSMMRDSSDPETPDARDPEQAATG